MAIAAIPGAGARPDLAIHSADNFLALISACQNVANRSRRPAGKPRPSGSAWRARPGQGTEAG